MDTYTEDEEMLFILMPETHTKKLFNLIYFSVDLDIFSL